MRVGAPSGAIENRFLRALRPPSLGRIGRHLEPVELNRRQRLYAPGDGADMVYFINRGLVSLVKPMTGGEAVEVGSVGKEGVVCLSGMLGLSGALLESVVHVPGEALRMKSAVFREEAEADPALREMILRYAELSFSQIAQTSACNALHHLEERCCRWLLVAHDSAGADEFPLTHEFLALMLGVQRPGVTLAAGALQKAGLIRYGKGRVEILDRPGLEANSCECYRAVRAKLQQFLGAV